MLQLLKVPGREGQGVKVRVECGPSDVSRRTCVLALSKKAGELAEKQTFQVTLYRRLVSPPEAKEYSVF